MTDMLLNNRLPEKLPCRWCRNTMRGKNGLLICGCPYAGLMQNLNKLRERDDEARIQKKTRSARLPNL